MTANPGRTVVRWAGATDVGRVRSNNQDQYMLRPDVQLWVVADGMGGHRGGEVASDLACKEMARSYHQRTVDGLVQAVSSANRVVHEAGEADPDLRGMGTTLVALAVVSNDEPDASGAPQDAEVLAVANVGDSRAYRQSAGELEQLTEDHSLVADMVREGQLAPEEAEKHPQKNILTRVLGVYEEIPVDIVTVTPQAGDRFLLCSDGLFNEVPESEIAAVLRRLDDPEEASDELVRLALANGARDNTTVVIVDVLDTTGGAGLPSQLAATTPRPVETPSGSGSGGIDPGPATQPIGVVTAEPVTARAPDLDGPGGEMEPDLGPDPAEPARHDPQDLNGNGESAVRKPRRFTWRVALFSLLLIGLVGGVVATIQWWAKAVYYVGFEDDQVAVYRGRPGGVLWINPELVEQSPLERADVNPVHVDSVDEGREFTSQEDAEEFVDTLVDQATTYLVAFDDERVALSVDRPGAEPEVTERLPLERGDLTRDQREDLDNGRSFATEADAEEFVDGLQSDADRRAAAADERSGDDTAADESTAAPSSAGGDAAELADP